MISAKSFRAIRGNSKGPAQKIDVPIGGLIIAWFILAKNHGSDGTPDVILLFRGDILEGFGYRLRASNDGLRLL